MQAPRSRALPVLCLALVGTTACVSDEYSRIQEQLVVGKEQAALELADGFANGSQDTNVIGLQRVLAAKLSMQKLRGAQQTALTGDVAAAAMRADEALGFHAGNLAARPFSADLHSLHAIDKFGDGDYVAAEFSWRKALDVLPGHGAAAAGLPLALNNRSCQEFEAAREHFERNTKNGLNQATELFRSVQRRSPDLCSAPEWVEASEARRARRLLAEADHLVSEAPTLQPGVAVMLAREAQRADPSVGDLPVIDLASDLLELESRIHLTTRVEATNDHGERLAEFMAFQLADLSLSPLVDTGRPSEFEREWLASRNGINTRRREFGATSDVTSACPIVSFEVKVDLPSYTTKASAARTLKSKYLHGTKQVSNPAIPKLDRQISDLESDLALHIASREAKQLALDAIDNVWVRMGAQVALDLAVGTENGTRRKLETVRGKRSAAPAQITVEDVRDYTFSERTISRECAVVATVTIVDPAGRLPGELEPITTTEIETDVRRTGVKEDDRNSHQNRVEELPPDEQILQDLYPDLEAAVWKSVSGQIAAWRQVWRARSDIEAHCRKLYLDEQELVDLSNEIKLKAKTALAAAIDASMAPAEVYPAYEAMTFPVAPYQLALPAAALVAAPSR